MAGRNLAMLSATRQRRAHPRPISTTAAAIAIGKFIGRSMKCVSYTGLFSLGNDRDTPRLAPIKQ